MCVQGEHGRLKVVNGLSIGWKMGGCGPNLWQDSSDTSTNEKIKSQWFVTKLGSFPTQLNLFTSYSHKYYR